MSDLSYENKLWKQGMRLVAGIDEVGRGCLAGPLFTAAVVFKPDMVVDKNITIDDSKKLTPVQRDRAYNWIKKNAAGYALGTVSSQTIDKKGIVNATNIAFRSCTNILNEKLGMCLEYLLIDAMVIPYLRGFPIGNGKLTGYGRQHAIIKGDSVSFSIAAASIVAKVERDKFMRSLADTKGFKVYEWGRNKGYGTQIHRSAIRKYGICKYHRKTFLKNVI